MLRPPHEWPALPHLPRDPLDLLHRSVRRIPIRRPQPPAQDVRTRRDINRQKAIAVVVAVEEPAFLPTVQRIVGHVHVQHDLLGRLGIAVQEQFHQQDVFAQAVVVIDVFVSERKAKQALGEEALQGMLAVTGIAVISEAGCQTPGSGRRAGRRPAAAGPRHRRTSGRRQSGAHFPTALIEEIDCDTVCVLG